MHVGALYEVSKPWNSQLPAKQLIFFEAVRSQAIWVYFQQQVTDL